MRIARGGGIFVFPAIGLFTAVLISYPFNPLPWHRALTLITLLPLLLMLWFFRDPDRHYIGESDLPVVIAPADGRITAVENRDDGCSLSVYLTLIDVHVIRMPLDGRVRGVTSLPGGHRPAGSAGAVRNAAVEVRCAVGGGEMVVRLVSGLLARRIVTYLDLNETGQAGMRLGLIRFGSRVDLELPAGYRPLVGIGERVRAGVSEVAVLETSSTISVQG
ncbi:phosphatidylserine decarboxylase [Candidatus Zixiibacteriota bacterium]